MGIRYVSSISGVADLPEYVSVEAHARLHVCLIDMNGSIGRVDGSVGVVLSEPTLKVTARRSNETRIDDELVPFAQSFFRAIGEDLKVELKLDSSFETHVGLGSTTQLALSVAKCLSELMGRKHGVRDLAAIMGRGGTSGIGVAGFEGGGSLIVDGGHRFGQKWKTGFVPSDYSENTMPAQPIVKLLLPRHWRFVVAIPKIGRKIYGELEKELFRKFTPIPEAEVGYTARIVLMKLLPAAVEGDIDEFGDAINTLQRVGFKKLELASQPQAVREVMEEGLRQGAAGAGMSSFGPAVYFLVEGEKDAKRLSEALHSVSEKIYVAAPWSGGATFSVV